MHVTFNVKNELCHRTNLSQTHLHNVYYKLKVHVTEDLNTCNRFAHTTDFWQDQHSGRHYISRTCLYVPTIVP